MKQILTAVMAGIIVLATGTGTGMCHPHVFIAQQTHVVFDQKGLAGIRVKWAFDEMFSTMILDDFDLDRNGALDQTEVAAVKEGAFSYIASYNYYIHIKIEGKPFAVKFIKDFNAEVVKGSLVYEFFIPCHVTAMPAPKEIVISPYDPEFYSAIYFPDKGYLMFENADNFTITSKADIDRNTLIYYDTVNPYALFLTFKAGS